MSYGGLAYLFNNPASPEVSVLFTSWREIKSAWLGEWGENLTVGTSVSEEALETCHRSFWYILSVGSLPFQASYP